MEERLNPRKALLIGVPTFGLQAPEHDVALMAEVLREYNFAVSTCTCQHATRKNIVGALQKLYVGAEHGDILVIYFSGHGSHTFDVANSARTDLRDLDLARRAHHQFLVPFDYNIAPNSEFQGVLDIELSAVLHRITSEKTKNVTVILDCCFAGGMARTSLQNSMVRTLSPCPIETVRKHIQKIKVNYKLPTYQGTLGNPDVVRIEACSSSERAFERSFPPRHRWNGAFTKALAKALSSERSPMHDLSWNQIMLHVVEIMHRGPGPQNPRVEGPGDRMPFSIMEVHPVRDGIYLRAIEGEKDRAILSAGSLALVHPGDRFTVHDLNSKNTHDVKDSRATVLVQSITPFTSEGIMLSRDSANPFTLSPWGNWAVLEQSALRRLPVACHELDATDPLVQDISKSKFVRPALPQDTTPCIAQCLLDKSKLNVHLIVSGNIELTCLAHTTSEALESNKILLEQLEQLARARHLLALQHPKEHETFRHKVKIGVALVETKHPGKPHHRTLSTDGNAEIKEGEHIYIHVQNQGSERVYIWLLYVNVAGKVGKITDFDLNSNKFELVGQQASGLQGLEVSWPQIPRNPNRTVRETILAIVTDSYVNLNHLQSTGREVSVPENYRQLPGFVQLTWDIWSGGGRVSEVLDPVKYDIISIPFTLHSTGNY